MVTPSKTIKGRASVIFQPDTFISQMFNMVNEMKSAGTAIRI